MDNSKIAMTTEQKWKLPFLLIVIGQSISLIGSSAVQFALIWWITSETNKEIASYGSQRQFQADGQKIDLTISFITRNIIAC